MKWLGLMLSDHLDALRKMDKEDKTPPPEQKVLMSEVERSRILQQAYTSKRLVNLQANVLNSDSNYYPDLQCTVLGFQGNNIYLYLKDGRNTTCQINQIRNIEFMNSTNWYNKK